MAWELLSKPHSMEEAFSHPSSQLHLQNRPQILLQLRVVFVGQLLRQTAIEVAHQPIALHSRSGSGFKAEEEEKENEFKKGNKFLKISQYIPQNRSKEAHQQRMEREREKESEKVRKSHESHTTQKTLPATSPLHYCYIRVFKVL